MLIKFDDIVREYGTPRGVIHIGAHLMEERNDYKNNNINHIIWIEANPYIHQNINKYSSENEYILNYAISDEDNIELELKITNNGQSSSLLDLELHKKHHPHIYVSDSVKVTCRRMDSIIEEYKFNLDNYNFLNIDIQGMELKAMIGFGDLISKMDYIYTEVNSNFLYKNCALITDIDEYLDLKGFKRVETSMTEYEWGDALYIKK